jgi:hypothetical protein
MEKGIFCPITVPLVLNAYGLDKYLPEADRPARLGGPVDVVVGGKVVAHSVTGAACIFECGKDGGCAANDTCEIYKSGACRGSANNGERK